MSYIVDAAKSNKLSKYLQNKSFFFETDPSSDWLVSKGKKLDALPYNVLKHALEEVCKNKELWLPHGPIMVVCYNNHALDQFLKGRIYLFTKTF